MNGSLTLTSAVGATAGRVFVRRLEPAHIAGTTQLVHRLGARAAEIASVFEGMRLALITSMERRWNVGRLVATGAVVLFATAIVLNDGRFETPTVEPVGTERVAPRAQGRAPRPAADRDEMMSAEELAQLQSRWRTVLEQGWVGAEATGTLVNEVLPESESAEPAVLETEVLASEVVTLVPAVDEAEAPEEADEDEVAEADEDEVADTTVESTANAQLEEQIAGLQLELDVLTSRVAALELDNQMLVTATATQRDQLALLRMQLALRTLAR